MKDFTEKARALHARISANVFRSDVHPDDDVEAIASALREAEAKWMMAQKALNQIDDGFEYRYGDEKSRAFVHKVLADYTSAIHNRGEAE